MINHTVVSSSNVNSNLQNVCEFPEWWENSRISTSENELRQTRKKNIVHVDVFWCNQWVGAFISKYLDDGDESDLIEIPKYSNGIPHPKESSFPLSLSPSFILSIFHWDFCDTFFRFSFQLWFNYGGCYCYIVTTGCFYTILFYFHKMNVCFDSQNTTKWIQ